MVYIFLIIGLCLLLLGANFLVDSSTAIAKRAKISDFIIGLTIIGMGTSAPELYISISSALNGFGDIALGNVIGSNICNTMLILGVTAIVYPVVIERSNLYRDIPIGMLLAIMLAVLCYVPLLFGDAPGLSRWAGAILLLGFVYVMCKMFKSGNKSEISDEVVAVTKIMKLPLVVLIAIVCVSLVSLIYGGSLFLDSAIDIAHIFGMSESVIAITIIAVGTSLPELITCVIAGIKGNSQLALGNVFGSNIFNILLVLGTAASINPLSLNTINLVDFGVLILSTILTFVFAFTLRRRVIDRAEGVILLVCYIAYSSYLLIK